MAKRETRRTFKIDVFSPRTIGMERLAAYLGDLAKLLGEKEKVHFVRVKPGSLVIEYAIETEAKPKIENRLRSIAFKEGPQDAMNAYEAINTRLADDNGIGTLTDETGAEIIQFPGRMLPQPEVFGPITEEGSIDGRIVAIGGSGAGAYVHLRSERDTFACDAEHHVAKPLAEYLFTPMIVRVYGSGRWTREADGVWQMKGFTINRYTILNTEPLASVISDLQAIPGSQWPEVDDPWAELAKIRKGPKAD